MTKEELMEMNGAVSDALLESRYRAVPGDKLTMETSPADMTKGRITFRQVEARSAMHGPGVRAGKRRT